MCWARYILPLVLLTLLTSQCDAQVNAFGIAGGRRGGIIMKDISSVNDGAQVMNTINSNREHASQPQKVYPEPQTPLAYEDYGYEEYYDSEC